jgi:hypothetical protein
VLSREALALQSSGRLLLTATTQICIRYGLIRLAAHLGENAAVVQAHFKDRVRCWLQIAEKFAICGNIKCDPIARNFRISNCFQRLDPVLSPL